MRFMMFVQIPSDIERWEPTAEEVERMMAYNEELVKAGIVLAMDGLHPPTEGARIEFGADGGRVVDGPYAEAKEVVGGYWIIDVPTKEDAIAWASRAPMGEHEVIELRRVYEMEDFPEDVQAVAELSEEPPEQTKAR